jgi:hypothetical protein
MRTRHFLALLLFALSLALPACGHGMPPDEAIANLKNPDVEVRRHAADSLRTKEGVPPNAVAPLLDSYKTEQNPQVRGAILITLGKSGAPDAKPLIDQAVQTAPDKDNRRWAARALKYWMIQTGKLPADYTFPKDWPYGQPGYPAPLPE